jgi:hypothetical protein
MPTHRPLATPVAREGSRYDGGAADPFQGGEIMKRAVIAAASCAVAPVANP